MANTTLTMTCVKCGRTWTAGPTGNLTACPRKSCGGEAGAGQDRRVPAVEKARRKTRRTEIGRGRGSPH